jgi:C-terminal processing protease CtpA/Prc
MKPVIFALAGALALGPWQGTQMDATSRERARVMLRHAYDLVRKHYYDEKFHGLDLDARYRSFDDQVRAAPSLNASMAIVADFLDGLQDSHTYFVPPARPYDFDYGYRSQAYGNRVFVTHIRPGSDAATKLEIGDEILVLNGVPLGRDTVSRMRYILNVLSPQPSLALTVAGLDGKRRDVSLTTRSRQGKRRLDLTTIDSEDFWRLIRQSESDAEDSGYPYYEMGKVMVWKMPSFMMEATDVDAMFDIVRKHEALVLDLRGNPGGRVGRAAAHGRCRVSEGPRGGDPRRPFLSKAARGPHERISGVSGRNHGARGRRICIGGRTLCAGDSTRGARQRGRRSHVGERDAVERPRRISGPRHPHLLLLLRDRCGRADA